MKNLILASLLVSSVALAGAGSGAAPAAHPAAAHPAAAGAPAVVAPMPPPTASRVAGPKAKQWIRALKLTAVKSTKGKNKWTWAAKTMSCESIEVGADGIDDYNCQVDGKRLSGAAAFVLHDAMQNADVPADSGMSKTHVDAKSVTCTDDQSASGGADAMYVCEYTAAH